MKTPGSESVAIKFIVPILVLALVVTTSILLYIMFSRSITNFTTEVLAAVLGVILVVTSVGITILSANHSHA